MQLKEIKDLTVHTDQRGWLAEIFRPNDVDNNIKGQFLITTAHPGIVKGNHYHARKHEWYCVMKGQMTLALVDTKTRKREEVVLTDKKLQIVKINPNVSHGFKNTGNEMAYLLIYIDETFDKNDPDTFPDVVIE